MSPAAISLLHKYQDEAARTSLACKKAFGDTQWIVDLDFLSSRAENEWRMIAEGRGLTIPTIAFVGPINSGKSWIAQSMLHNRGEAKKLLPDGVALRTDKLHWIGPERPDGMHHDAETFVQVLPEQLIDMGGGFQILDSPGIGDVKPECQQRAEMALSSAAIKVLVVRAEKIRAENYQSFIGDANGAIIVPVVNRCSGSPDLWPKNFGEKLKNLIREAAPQATIRDAICLPDYENQGWSEEEALIFVHAHLHPELRSIIEGTSENLRSAAESQLRIAHERFVERRAGILVPILAPFDEPLRELEEAESRLPLLALDYLLSDSGKVRLLIKNHYRASIMEAVPQLAFPFRSIAGLLILTAGAWDRAFLGVAGSFPSLLVAGWTSLKGLKDSQDALHALRDHVSLRLSALARSAVRVPLASVRQLLMRRSDGEDTQMQSQPVEFDVHGIGELAIVWNREVASAASETRVHRGIIGLATLLGSITFWFLLGGPLLHLYGQYVPASLRSWAGSWSASDFAAYPSFPPGFWLTALILSAIPSFLIALCIVAWALGSSRSLRAECLVRAGMNMAFESGALPLTLKISDEKLQALRFLARSRSGNIVE